MFSDEPADQDRARALCKECPLVVRCLARALRRPERHGIWGGMTAAGRSAMLAALRRRVDEAERQTTT